MKIGVSTASLYPTLLEDAVRLTAEGGVKETEIFINTCSEMEPQYVSELARLIAAYRLNVVSLHPFTSGFEPFMLFQQYTRRTKDGFDMYRRFFNIAATLGAKIFVLHGDKIGSTLPLYEYCERFLKLSELASFEGVTLTQENVHAFRACNPDFIRGMIGCLGRRALFTFDVKQTVRSGYSPWEVYDAMRGHIAHIHLSDHNDSSDCLLPGRGSFNFEKLFRIALADGFTGSALIEVYANAYTMPSQLFDSYRELCARYNGVVNS